MFAEGSYGESVCRRSSSRSIGSPNGDLAGAAGDFDLVAVGILSVAGALELELAAHGVESLLVEDQLADAAFHAQPRLDPRRTPNVHLARATGEAYRDHPRRLRKRQVDVAEPPRQDEGGQLQSAEVRLDLVRPAAHLDLPGHRGVKRYLPPGPTSPFEEPAKAAGIAEDHGAVCYFDLRYGPLEACPVELIHPGGGTEGELGNPVSEHHPPALCRA